MIRMNELIQDTSDKTLRKYFTIIPNMIDDMDLSPYAFRLYHHYKRVAGDNGLCWQSTKTLSEACKMSIGSIVNAREELKAAGLIEISTQPTSHGGREYNIVSIIDMWDENMKNISITQNEVPSSPHELASSPHELIKNPLNNIPISSIPNDIIVESGSTTRLRLDINTNVKNEKASFSPLASVNSNSDQFNNFPPWVHDLKLKGYPDRKKLNNLLKIRSEPQVKSALEYYITKQEDKTPHWSAALNAATKFFVKDGNTFDFNIQLARARKSCQSAA